MCMVVWLRVWVRVEGAMKAACTWMRPCKQEHAKANAVPQIQQGEHMSAGTWVWLMCLAYATRGPTSMSSCVNSGCRSARRSSSLERRRRRAGAAAFACW